MRVNPPASRRAILGALAVAPVAALSPSASLVLADEPHPDAALLALCAEYEAAERVYLDLVEQFDEIDGRADATRPPYPDALRRTDDFRHFYGRAASPHSPVFYTPEECQRFRGYVPQGHQRREDREAARARATAIVAAYDAWSEASEQHDIASGLNAAEDRCTEAFGPLCALREKVLTLRPSTLAGAAAKARVWDLCRDAKLAAAICADLVAMGGAA